jgi:hypothetical protein
MRKIWLLLAIFLMLIPTALAETISINVTVVPAPVPVPISAFFAKMSVNLVGIGISLGAFVMILRAAIYGTEPEEKIKQMIMLLVMVALVMFILGWMAGI